MGQQPSQELQQQGQQELGYAWKNPKPEVHLGRPASGARLEAQAAPTGDHSTDEQAPPYGDPSFAYRSFEIGINKVQYRDQLEHTKKVWNLKQSSRTLGLV
jgi:hypothetical protein